ncbi:MAG: hypothetical protein K5892_02540 [Acholeplasmatales bacterium]|nr:hypothetical protein [Acholeplasmatales bacterium]
MNKLKVLGPKGTYSDVAAKAFLKDLAGYEVEYEKSILNVSKNINDNLAVLPFENTLDGFVLESLDQIIYNDLKILKQYKLSIDFAFVSNAKKIEDIKNVYVQFKAYGQCLDFLSKYNFNVLKTESNIESLNLLLKADNSYGAIIPIHSLNDYKFNLEIKHVADSKNNETRFFLVSKEKSKFNHLNECEASILFNAIIDKPGILFNILKRFHDRNINLKAIMSRPSKNGIGQYNFYIECSLNSNDLKILYELIDEVNNTNELKAILLGVYDTI